MDQQFSLAGCQVDLSRNLIVCNGNEQILPPKTMLVLCYLAKQPNQVHSTEQIMQNVWQDTKVSANSVQRCITELRKALGDDGKTQAVIKTHAKQGYSLECDVTFSQPTPAKNGHVELLRRPIPITVTVLLIVLIGWVISYQSNQSQFSLNHQRFGDAKAITATDAKESGGSYTPDEQSIVFHRYQGICRNNIWLKDRKSQQETQLTAQVGWYGKHSFSPDGKQMVFNAQQDCLQSKRENGCWDVMTLDFEAAIKAPQQPKLMLSCGAEPIGNPAWLNNGAIAMIQRRNGQWQVVLFWPNSKKTEVIFWPKNKQIYHLSYSATHDLLALMSVDSTNRIVLELLHPDGSLFAGKRLTWQDGDDVKDKLYPNFDATAPRLVASHDKRIVEVTFAGIVSPITQRFNHRLLGPVMSGDGTKMLASSGVHDSDIGRLNIDDLSKAVNPLNKQARSIYADKEAKFQPSGELIAFISERTGSDQVWLLDKAGAKRLSQFEQAKTISGLAWHKQGKRLAFVADEKLYVLSIDGALEEISFAYPLLELLQWHDDGVLLRANIDGQPVVLSLTVATGEFSLLISEDVSFAAISDSGIVVYTDKDRIYWRQLPGAAPQPIKALENRPSAGRFVLEKNQVYGIDSQQQLWVFSLAQNQLKIIGKVPGNIENLNDINTRHLLMTQLISQQKQVVELSLLD